jgi:hypothetical protein
MKIEGVHCAIQGLRRFVVCIVQDRAKFGGFMVCASSIGCLTIPCGPTRATCPNWLGLSRTGVVGGGELRARSDGANSPKCCARFTICNIVQLSYLKQEKPNYVLLCKVVSSHGEGFGTCIFLYFSCALVCGSQRLQHPKNTINIDATFWGIHHLCVWFSTHMSCNT